MALTQGRCMFLNDKGVLEEVGMVELSLDTPVSYPKEFFKNNKHTKPKLIIHDFAPGYLQARINNEAIEHKLTNEEVIAIIYQEFSKAKYQVNLTKDWTTYEIDIGKAGNKIGPFDLVEIETVNGDSTKDTKTGDIPLEKAAYSLLCIYRLLDIKYRTYSDSIREKIGTFLEGKNYECRTIFNDMSTRYQKLSHSIDYNKIVGVIDMFFFNTNSDYSGLRIGTMTSRWRDCRMIDLINKVNKQFGHKFTIQTAQYLFLKGPADNMKNILVEGNEINVPESYTPYLKDLKLCEKSPYSVTFNPDLHFWCATVLAFFGYIPALNMRKVCNVRSIEIINHALTLCFLKKTKAMKEEELGTTNITPEDVYNYIAEMKGLPQEVIKYANDSIEKWHDLRIGTVGAFIKDSIPK